MEVLVFAAVDPSLHAWDIVLHSVMLVINCVLKACTNTFLHGSLLICH